jgi:hypothetical protein
LNQTTIAIAQARLACILESDISLPLRSQCSLWMAYSDVYIRLGCFEEAKSFAQRAIELAKHANPPLAELDYAEERYLNAQRIENEQPSQIKGKPNLELPGNCLPEIRNSDEGLKLLQDIVNFEEGVLEYLGTFLNLLTNLVSPPISFPRFLSNL